MDWISGRSAGLGICAIAMMILVLGATMTWAAESVTTLNDRELATVVVGQDSPRDIEKKLGSSPCLVPSASGETMSYLYNVQGAEGVYFLRLEVNGQVDAMTVSKDPPLTGVCYSPVRQTVPVTTGRGIKLGATPEEVVKLYGKPAETFAVGPLMRYRFVAMLDRSYEWDLVFRNGRLVEWTVVTEE